jgi:hypothetical protein
MPLPRRRRRIVDPLVYQQRTLAARVGAMDTTQMDTNETNITLIDGRVTTLEAEQQGIIEGGRAEILTGTFTSVNGGNADLSA